MSPFQIWIVKRRLGVSTVMSGAEFLAQLIAKYSGLIDKTFHVAGRWILVAIVHICRWYSWNKSCALTVRWQIMEK